MGAAWSTSKTTVRCIKEASLRRRHLRAHHLSGARATDLMHGMGGTNGIYTRRPLQRHCRYAQTAAITGRF
jgi:hypothetical protein